MKVLKERIWGLSALFIKIYNNSCFSLTISNIKFLIDPCVSIKQLNSIDYDYVIISHGHGDHCLNINMIDKPIISNKQVAKRLNDIIISKPFTIGNVEIIPLDTKHPHWLQDNIVYDFLLNILTIKRFMRCGESLGFIIRGENYTIYYSGDDILDTERLAKIKDKYSPDMALISFQPIKYPIFNLLSPLREKESFKKVLGCPVLPLHLSNNWYQRHSEIYTKHGVQIQ